MGAVLKRATHLLRLAQGPGLAIWMRLSQETDPDTTQRVGGQDADQDGACRVGLVAGGRGDGTAYVHVGASHHEIRAVRRW